MPKDTETFPANAICHFDVSGPDMRSLKQFYALLFGWKISDQGPGYALVETPAPRLRGAIVDADEASIVVGITVANLDKALRTAEKSGGTVIMPRTDNGWVVKAQVADPAGNRLTLIQQ